MRIINVMRWTLALLLLSLPCHAEESQEEYEKGYYERLAELESRKFSSGDFEKGLKQMRRQWEADDQERVAAEQEALRIVERNPHIAKYVHPHWTAFVHVVKKMRAEGRNVEDYIQPKNAAAPSVNSAPADHSVHPELLRMIKEQGTARGA